MRRDGRGAALGPPPPPSQIPSQGSFGLGVTYRDGIPLKSCGAAETPRPSSVAASRGVRINSTSTSLHCVRTGGCCCCCCCCFRRAAHTGIASSFSLSASQCAAVSAEVLPPVPADALKIWLGRACNRCQSQKKEKEKRSLPEDGVMFGYLQWSGSPCWGARRDLLRGL